MTSSTPLQTPAPPSLATLAKTTVIALVVAAVILVTIVLPAEYAIDPVGTGRWLGLTEIASPTLVPVDIATAKGAALAPVQNGPLGVYPAEFQFDVFEISLAPYEYVEYKYQHGEGRHDAVFVELQPPQWFTTFTGNARLARVRVPRRRASTSRTAGRRMAA